MEKLEIEVKFFLPEFRSLHQKILDLGARSRGRFFEKNLRFDDANQTLESKECLLRLRHDRKTTLTFKSKLPESSYQFKVLKELEVEIGDFAIMNDILESIGFHCQQTYEKWRETLIIGNTQFCLDTMPYGNFLEIEGTQNDIRQFTQDLGLQWGKRILANYLEIFDILKEKFDLQFTDVTFDNFKDIDAQLHNYLHLIEAGDNPD
ncbi:MAG: class IV adenylate cyclase [Desulfobacterales bacterium]|jgi:adenylate cyclase class 2